ncbi:MAG: WD40 repeat domain-containing protein, partial [Rhizonema sp. PD38]|nr:WD40 repeat domain-containing protein [Rhizonema sp. PD38]
LCTIQTGILNISQNKRYLIIKNNLENSVSEYILSNNQCYPTKANFQHNESVTHAIFSRNDKLLATLSKDGVLKLWNINSKIPIFRIKKGNITNIKFSYDTRIVAMGSDNNTIELQKRNGTFITTIPGDSSILSFSHDNQTLVTSSTDDFLKLWKFGRKQEISLKGGSNHITSIDFSDDGKLIAAASADNFIRLWHSDGTLVKILPTNNEKVPSIIFSPDSHLLAVISNNSVTLYKSNGTLIKTLPRRTEEVTSIIFSHNSQMLATIGDDNLIELYKSDGDLIKTLIEHSTKVSSVEFSRDNSKLISVSPESDEIKIWRSNDGKLLKPIDNYGTLSAHFSPSSNYITSLNIDNTVKLWSLNGELLTALKGHSSRITQVSFSFDETKIATSSDDSTIKLWDVKKLLAQKDNYVPLTLREHTQGINDVNFSHDGKLIASASADATVKLWHSSNGKYIGSMPKFADDIGISQVNFSTDDKILSTIGVKSNGTGRCNYIVKLWSIRPKLKPIKIIRGHVNKSCEESTNINSFIRFNPDTKTVTFVSKDDILKLWNIEGKQLASLIGHTDWVNSVTFSPDGKTIASSSDDKKVILWDLNGKMKALIPHNDKVNSVSFSYNGKIIASASNDRTVNFWNVNGVMVYKPFNSSDKVTSLVFSPDEDNKDLLAFSSGSTLTLENLNGKSREPINETSSSSSVLSFSKYGKELAFGDYGSKVNLHLLDGIWRKEVLLYPISAFSGIPFSPDVQTISVANNEGTLLLNTDLDDLLNRACGWASAYLKNNQNVPDGDRKICDDILPSR